MEAGEGCCVSSLVVVFDLTDALDAVDDTEEAKDEDLGNARRPDDPEERTELCLLEVVRNKGDAGPRAFPFPPEDEETWSFLFSRGDLAFGTEGPALEIGLLGTGGFGALAGSLRARDEMRVFAGGLRSTRGLFDSSARGGREIALGDNDTLELDRETLP